MFKQILLKKMSQQEFLVVSAHSDQNLIFCIVKLLNASSGSNPEITIPFQRLYLIDVFEETL